MRLEVKEQHINYTQGTRRQDNKQQNNKNNVKQLESMKRRCTTEESWINQDYVQWGRKRPLLTNP